MTGESVDAREVIATALWDAQCDGESDASDYADVIVAALSAAGLTICEEQVGYFHRAGMHVHPDSWNGELPPVFVPVGYISGIGGARIHQYANDCVGGPPVPVYRRSGS